MMTVNLHTEKDYLMGYWKGLNLPRRGLVQHQLKQQKDIIHLLVTWEQQEVVKQ